MTENSFKSRLFQGNNNREKSLQIKVFKEKQITDGKKWFKIKVFRANNNRETSFKV